MIVSVSGEISLYPKIETKFAIYGIFNGRSQRGRFKGESGWKRVLANGKMLEKWQIHLDGTFTGTAMLVAKRIIATQVSVKLIGSSLGIYNLLILYVSFLSGTLITINDTISPVLSKSENW